MTPDIRRELLSLLSGLCDDELTDAEHARLEALLDAEAECRRLYLEYLDQHAHLLDRPHRETEGERPVTVSASRPPGPAVSPPLRLHRRYVLVAAGTLAASLLVQLAWWRPAVPDAGRGPDVAKGEPPGYVATLTRAADCAWEDGAEARPVGARLLPGELRLRRGVARLHFDGGADLTVEGPAVLRLESATAAAVLRGKVVFQAADADAPFDLHTPASTLVDLGTEYAVAVGPEGEEVHVFAGEVRRTPRTAGTADAERLAAGAARRYTAAASGTPTALDPQRFVRQVNDTGPPDPAAGLLALEHFDYADPRAMQAGRADGGTGWVGPWRPGFARPIGDGDPTLPALNVRPGLTRPGGDAAGGSFDYTGFAKYFRRLARPVRLDTDGVYYFSFLLRREGPPADEVNSVSVQLRTDAELELELGKRGLDLRQRLNFGVDRTNDLSTHLLRLGARAPLPLSYGETYLLVAKVVAGAANPDQVFVRLYGPQEPVECGEPASWSIAGREVHCDLVFDWLEVHINSRTRQTLDEVRVGTTWASAAGPWTPKPKCRP